MHSGGTVDLSDGVAGLDGGNLLDGDGNVDTVFGDNLVAGRLDHLGHGASEGNGGNSGGEGGTSIELGVSFGLTLLQNDGGAHGGNGGGTLLRNDFLALLFISNFLAGDFLGFTDIFNPGSARLNLDFFFLCHTNGGKRYGMEDGGVVNGGSVRVSSQKLGVSLGARGGIGRADEAENGNLYKIEGNG